MGEPIDRCRCGGTKLVIAELCRPCRDKAGRGQAHRRVCACGRRKKWTSEKCRRCDDLARARRANGKRLTRVQARRRRAARMADAAAWAPRLAAYERSET